MMNSKICYSDSGVVRRVFSQIEKQDMAVVKACQARLHRPWDLATSRREGDERRLKRLKARRVTEVRPLQFCIGHTSRGSKSQW